MFKKLLPYFVASLSVSADLVITEVMSGSSHPLDNDWWELTNTGSSAVDLSGYYWDDDGANGNDGAFFPNVTLGAGESLIVTAGTRTDFLTMWGDAGGPMILDEADFTGPDTFSGLSGTGGDQIQIWTLDPNVVPTAPLVAEVEFGPATIGFSFQWSADGSVLGLSSVGQNNAIMALSNAAGAAGTDVGSPGFFVPADTLVSPVFSAPSMTFWREGMDLATSEFRVVATDPNLGETITLTLSDEPAWLSLASVGNGIASLSGTPTESGMFTFVVTATDSSGMTAAAVQEYVFYVFADNNSVILNEYNAVGNGDFLSGIASTDSDTHFGRVLGNGGDWFELVVTGPGDTANDPVTPQAGSTVDMRGWRVDVISTAAVTESIVLSDDDYWAAVPAGTILTFSENDSANGGLDTGINRNSQLSSSGYTWTNIHLLDPFYIDQSLSTFANGVVINSLNTRFQIFDELENIVYGPSGEGIIGRDSNGNGVPDDTVNVNAEEVFKLEEDPTPSIDAMFGAYFDGGSSSFGAPNIASGGAFVQSFTLYVTSNTPPTFDSSPVLVPTGTSYSYSIAVSDTDGQTPSITATNIPSFLTLTDNGDGTAMLVANRAITLADTGMHEVELLANDGEASWNVTPQKFILTVRTGFENWLIANLITDMNFETDSDGDGFSNIEEYAFGGLPNDATSFPCPMIDAASQTLTIDVRTNDSLLVVNPEWSVDLDTWNQTDLMTSQDAASTFGAEYSLRSFQYTGGTQAKLFLRVVAP